MAGALMSVDQIAAPAVTQKAFDDFHLYDLNRQVTLKDRETKQVEFIRASAIPVTRKYVYDGAENLPGAIDGELAYALQPIPALPSPAPAASCVSQRSPATYMNT